MKTTISILLSLLLIVSSCKKKEDAKSTPSNSSTSNTNTAPASPYAAEFRIESSYVLGEFSTILVVLRDGSGQLVSKGYVNCSTHQVGFDAKKGGFYYNSPNPISNYSWEFITVPGYADTLINATQTTFDILSDSPYIIYDKTKDFTISLWNLNFDTAIVNLGGLEKKIAGSNSTSLTVTYKPGDKVTVNSSAGTVSLSVKCCTYEFRTIRNRVWKFYTSSYDATSYKISP